MDVIKAWTAGLIFLGAIFLVGTHGAGLAQAAAGAEKFFAGSEGAVLRGGAGA